MTITDWRVDLASGRAVYFPGCIEVDISEHPVAKQLHDFLSELSHSASASEIDQFSATVGMTRYRFQRLKPSLYSLRVVPSEIPEIQDLGHRGSVVKALLDPVYNAGGLILISGAAGSGKSTTTASVIRERLRRFGGYCLTIEDPIEYHLDGFHGTGYCNQIEADSTEDYMSQIKRAKRGFPARTPGLLYLGEIRDHYTAEAAAQMAVAGFLVISTIHSFNIVSAIQNYLELMDAENSSIARYTTASCLKLVIHQRWNQRGQINSDMLPISDQAAGAIKNGALHTLKDAIAAVESNIRRNMLGVA